MKSPSKTRIPLLVRSAIRTYNGDFDEDVERIGTIKNATAITGGLSKPSKMPEYGYSIPAKYCQVGSRLQKIRGTVCQRCYALTNRFRMPAVQAAMERRFQSLHLSDWTPAIGLLLLRRRVEYMRWHDSGDLQSLPHLENLATVARHTPQTKHWLPTREYAWVAEYLDRHGDFPTNLTVRVSAHRIDGPPPAGFANTATVTASRPPAGSHVCPAPDQGNSCDGVIANCRACWDREVRNVVYWLH